MVRELPVTLFLLLLATGFQPLGESIGPEQHKANALGCRTTYRNQLVFLYIVLQLGQKLPLFKIPCGPGRPEPLFDRPSIVGQRLDGPVCGPALNVGNDRLKLP